MQWCRQVFSISDGRNWLQTQFVTVKRTSRLSDPKISEVLVKLHARGDAHDAAVIPEVLTAAGERGASTDFEMADLLAGAFCRYIRMQDDFCISLQCRGHKDESLNSARPTDCQRSILLLRSVPMNRR